MTDPNTCPHDDTIPVDVRSHQTGGTVTVARICRDCLAQLHAGWGCPACDWETAEVRRLCDPRVVPLPVLVRPCKEHA